MGELEPSSIPIGELDSLIHSQHPSFMIWNILGYYSGFISHAGLSCNNIVTLQPSGIQFDLLVTLDLAVAYSCDTAPGFGSLDPFPSIDFMPLGTHRFSSFGSS
jgi:hypothetical protein